MEQNYEIHFKLDNQKRWIEMRGKSIADVKSRFYSQSFGVTGQLVELLAIFPAEK